MKIFVRKRDLNVCIEEINSETPIKIFSEEAIGVHYFFTRVSY